MYIDEEITKEMIIDGLLNGTIQIINNENDGCISAQIGDFWFYFTGNENDTLLAKEYLEVYDLDTISDMIYRTINEEPINGQDEDDACEWLYYKFMLSA